MYVCIFDLAAMICFHFWQPLVSIVFLSLVPVMLNGLILIISKERQATIFSPETTPSWVFAGIYGLLGTIGLTAFTLFVWITVTFFLFDYDHLYPYVGMQYMNLYQLLTMLVNSLYIFSLIRLLYTLRRHHSTARLLFWDSERLNKCVISIHI